MNLAIEPDIYQPSVAENGIYMDYLPPSSLFANGLRCCCGARKDHVFDNRQSFGTHIKSKTHQKWLAELNVNKLNYYTECIGLKELVNSQKIIIAQFEKELNLKIKTIDYLTEQLISKEPVKNIDFLTFD